MDFDFQPLSNRVLVEITDDQSGDRETESGIIVPDMDEDNQVYAGEVLAVGNGRFMHGSREEMQLKEGDQVLFSEYQGRDLPVGNEETTYRVIRENNIMNLRVAPIKRHRAVEKSALVPIFSITMSSANYRKGTGYERELSDKLASMDIPANRTWGSDGRSRGLSKKVDLIVGVRIYWQLKRPGDIPKYLYPPDRDHVHCIEETGSGNVWVVLWMFPQYINLLRKRLITPEIHKSSRKKVGKDWKPDDPVVAQIMRADYEKGDDLAVMSATDFRRMIHAIKNGNA
jgi:chaperonin GroES